MLEFLKSPIHLKIAAGIIKKGEDIKDISSLHTLYYRLCEVLEVSETELQMLIPLTELMIKERTVHLAYPLISPPILIEVIFLHISQQKREAIANSIIHFKLEEKTSVTFGFSNP
jgi:hypothetical protein